MNVVAMSAPSLARLNNLVAIVEELREIHPDMTLNQLIVLLQVAANPGISQKDIMDKTGLADSSASRIVSILSEYGDRATGPFHLIELIPSKNDRRYKELFMTKKGRALIDRLLNLMGKGLR